jgi:hypothetical protein
MKYLYLPASPALLPLRLFFPKVALTTENEACILREVTDGLLRREIWIQANAEDDPRTLQKVDAGKYRYFINRRFT